MRRFEDLKKRQLEPELRNWKDEISKLFDPTTPKMKTKLLCVFGFLFVFSVCGCERNDADLYPYQLYYTIDIIVPSSSSDPFSNKDVDVYGEVFSHDFGLAKERGSKFLTRGVQFGHFGLLGNSGEHEALQRFLRKRHGEAWRVFSTEGIEIDKMMK